VVAVFQLMAALLELLTLPLPLEQRELFQRGERACRFRAQEGQKQEVVWITGG
jgi:hypothetical protein